MINLLLGAPGGGKSYEACVFHILPALQKGRKVVTNLPVDLDMFAAIDPGFRDLIEVRSNTSRGMRDDGQPARMFAHVDDYADDWRHPEKKFGPLFVIDECHFAIPKGKTSTAVEEWYSMHRHFNVDVLLISQSHGKLSEAIRDLLQMVYRVRKNIALGAPSSYTRKVQDGVRGEVVNTGIRRYEKKYFPLYRSHTQGEAVDEFNASDVRPLWKHWTFMGAAGCAAIFLTMLFTGNVHAPWDTQLSPVAKAAPAKSAPVVKPAVTDGIVAAAPRPGASSVVVPVAPAAPPPPVQQTVVDPLETKGIHLLGVMQMGAKVQYLFALSQNGQVVSNMTDKELTATGYKFTPTGHCSGIVEFNNKVRPVMCDNPQIQMVGNASSNSVAVKTGGNLGSAVVEEQPPTDQMIHDAHNIKAMRAAPQS